MPIWLIRKFLSWSGVDTTKPLDVLQMICVTEVIGGPIVGFSVAVDGPARLLFRHFAIMLHKELCARESVIGDVRALLTPHNVVVVLMQALNVSHAIDDAARAAADALDIRLVFGPTVTVEEAGNSLWLNLPPE